VKNLIKLVNLQREFAEVKAEVLGAIESVCEQGSFILGENAERFESEFAAYVGSKFGCGVGSGTDALRIALEAAEIGAGDEVITVSHTFVATSDAIRTVGAKPVFVDVDPKTYNIDVSQLRSALTRRTRAVIPVHLYGQPAQLDELREFCDANSLWLIQDACQAHGAEYKGKRLGEYGDILCYSFYPSKDLGAYGDAGLITTDLREVVDRCKQLRNYGQTKKYYHDFLGHNSRLDELQAAVLRVKLRRLDEWIQKRIEAAKRYNGFFEDQLTVTTPYESSTGRHVYYLYVVLVDNRDVVRQRLNDVGVETGIHYPVPVHKQKSYSEYAQVSLPVTETLVQKILSLPLDPFIQEEEQKFVALSIKKVQSG